MFEYKRTQEGNADGCGDDDGEVGEYDGEDDDIFLISFKFLYHLNQTSSLDYNLKIINSKPLICISLLKNYDYSFFYQ